MPGSIDRSELVCHGISMFSEPSLSEDMFL
jgi:hypothetical protein